MNNPLIYVDPSGYLPYNFIIWLNRWLYKNRTVSHSGTWRLGRTAKNRETTEPDGGEIFSYASFDPWAGSGSSSTNSPGGGLGGRSSGGGSNGGGDGNPSSSNNSGNGENDSDDATWIQPPRQQSINLSNPNLAASSGGPGPEFSFSFWDWANKINNLGQRKWTDPESGVSYYINDAGEITGVYPITGIAPTPGFAKGVKVLQTGGHILKPKTLRGLNLTKQQGKTAIESMKKANGLRNDFHGKILNNGDVLDDLGNYIDNLFDYLY